MNFANKARRARSEEGQKLNSKPTRRYKDTKTQRKTDTEKSRPDEGSEPLIRPLFVCDRYRGYPNIMLSSFASKPQPIRPLNNGSPSVQKKTPLM